MHGMFDHAVSWVRMHRASWCRDVSKRAGIVVLHHLLLLTSSIGTRILHTGSRVFPVGRGRLPAMEVLLLGCQGSSYHRPWLPACVRGWQHSSSQRIRTPSGRIALAVQALDMRDMFFPTSALPPVDAPALAVQAKPAQVRGY